jgi:hypothetical protein
MRLERASDYSFRWWRTRDEVNGGRILGRDSGGRNSSVGVDSERTREKSLYVPGIWAWRCVRYREGFVVLYAGGEVTGTWK